MTTKYEVIGDLPIVGVDGEDVRKGGTVELDESVINVRALVEAGFVRPAGVKPAKAAAGRSDGGE